MSDLKIHPDDGHRHAPDCGHTAIKHEGHIDYVHEGHLHHPAGQTDSTLVEEHVIEVGSHNPVRCTPDHHCGGHAADTSTALVVVTRQYPMAIISITSLRITCTILMVITATITVLSKLLENAK